MPVSRAFVLFFIRQSAGKLCHCAHGAKRTPASRHVEHHDDETDYGRGQHQTVEAKAVLCDPVGCCAGCVGPVPRKPEGPEEFNNFAKALCPRCNKPCLKEHVSEHTEKEYEKAVAEITGRHPFWGGLTAAAFQVFAEKAEELSSAAHVIAEPFVSEKECHKQRNEKVYHSEPRKKNVEKAENKIQNGPDPQIIIPFFLHYSISSITIHPAGQFLAQIPHPTHREKSVFA